MIKLDPKTALKLRKQYHQLKDNGYRVTTFYKVQASNLGVHPTTIKDACLKNTWKDEEESSAQ